MTCMAPEHGWIWPVGLAMLLLTGCGGAPPAVQPEGTVNVLPERPSLRTDPGTPASRHAAKCLVRTVTLPLNRPIEVAWAVLDEGVLPDLSRAVWNANGLRVGILNGVDADDFGAALGPPDRLTDQTLIVINRPTVLRESPPLRADFVADLTRPPAPRHVEPFTGGRARLLISARPTAGGAALRITPQHHLPRTTLLARDPLEKLLDGRVFKELAALVELGPGRALVLGYGLPLPLRPPLPPAPDPDDASKPTDPADEAVAPTPDLDLDPASLPLDLGRALLTAGNPKREQQRLLVLTVVETR